MDSGKIIETVLREINRSVSGVSHESLEALVNAVKGDVDNGLLFCGSNAYRAQRIESTADIFAELASAFE